MSDRPVVSWYRRIGRVQLRFVVWRHRYFRSPDRWVFQPSLIYDRMIAASSVGDTDDQ